MRTNTFLSVELVSKRQSALEDAQRDRESRVMVFTIHGTQIGVPGVGEKNTENCLTFPRYFRVGEALQCTPWIRFATDEELAATPSGFVPQWWRELDFQPGSLIHQNGCVAHPDDPIGLVGNTLTAVCQSSIPAPVEEKACVDVSDISTPPTP